MTGYDLAVVGAGIVGLSHAAAALDRGLSVVVVERESAIAGASIRNFGHVGSSVHAGLAGEYARRSHESWLRWSRDAGFWLRESGTLLIARHDDEAELLREVGHRDLLSPDEVARIAPARGVVAGAIRPGDLQVDPRAAAPAIAVWLAKRGVEFRWRTSAVGAEPGILHTARGTIRADAIVFATGADVGHLHPDIAESAGIERCALDMLLTDGVGLRAPLLTATSMLRYSRFAGSAAAVAVRERLAAEDPALFELDINQMYTERPDGTLLVGDTHFVSATPSPFQHECAFAALLRLGRDLFGRPLAVRERWQGVYAKGREEFLTAAPAEGIRVVAVTTGIGMTTAPGLAESVVNELFGGS